MWTPYVNFREILNVMHLQLQQFFVVLNVWLLLIPHVNTVFQFANWKPNKTSWNPAKKKKPPPSIIFGKKFWKRSYTYDEKSIKCSQFILNSYILFSNAKIIYLVVFGSSPFCVHIFVLLFTVLLCINIITNVYAW